MLLRPLLVLIVVFAATPPEVLAARSVATCPQFAGKWSTDYGTLILHRSGAQVSGTQEWGGKLNKIAGTLSGNVLVGKWVQTNGSRWFRITESPDSRTFAGSRGFGPAVTNGGSSWLGTCI